MRNAQVTLFAIIGISILMVVLYFSAQEPSSEIDVSRGTLLFDSLDQCTHESVIQANEKFGIPIHMTVQYLNEVEQSVFSCMEPLMQDAIQNGYGVDIQSDPEATAQFFDESIVVTVDYPVTVTRGEVSGQFAPAVVTLPLRSSITVDGGLTTTTRSILSSDRNMILQIPPGTQITKDGSLVEKISIQTLDIHFDGMTNGIAVGKLAYEGLPEGTRFSKPVKVFMRIREEDIPSDITIDDLSVAWFGEKDEMWFGLQTTSQDDMIQGQTTHFTTFAAVAGCLDNGQNTISFETPVLFRQKYSLDGIACASGDVLTQQLQWGDIEPAGAYVYDGQDIESLHTLVFSQQAGQGPVHFNCDDDIQVTYDVPAQCCCPTDNPDPSVCLWEESCSQEYVQDMDELCKVNHGPNPMRSETTTVPGYSEESCALGYRENNNGIYSMKFLAGGNACVTAMEISPTSANCQIEADSLYDNGISGVSGERLPGTVRITRVEATEHNNLCAECSAQITVHGTGLVGWSGCTRPNTIYCSTAKKCTIENKVVDLSDAEFGLCDRCAEEGTCGPGCVCDEN